MHCIGTYDLWALAPRNLLTIISHHVRKLQSYTEEELEQQALSDRLSVLLRITYIAWMQW